MGRGCGGQKVRGRIVDDHRSIRAFTAVRRPKEVRLWRWLLPPEQVCGDKRKSKAESAVTFTKCRWRGQAK